MEDELDAVSRGEEDWTTPLEKFWKPFIRQVDKIEKTVTREQVAQARELGKDPASGKPITVRMGRYGPFVQIGTKDDEEKPRFAGLRPGQKMDAITLADAMELFKLPRTLGETRGGRADRRQRRALRSVRQVRQQVRLAQGGRSLHRDARAGARGHPPEAGSRRQPHHPGLRRRRHPGAERALRTVHHRQEEERQDPQGSRSEDAHARGMPRAARRGARAWRRFRSLGAAQGRHRGACRRRRRRSAGGCRGQGQACGEQKSCRRGRCRSRRSRPAAASSTCRQGTRPLARGSRQVSGRGSARRAWARRGPRLRRCCAASGGPSRRREPRPRARAQAARRRRRAQARQPFAPAG